MIKYNDYKKYGFNNASSSSKNITQHRKNHLLKIKMLKILVQGLQSVEILHELAETQHLSDRETRRNWKSCSSSSSANDYHGQYIILSTSTTCLLYSTLSVLSSYNNTTSSLQNWSWWRKGGKCGFNHSGILWPDKKNHQIFHWIIYQTIVRKTQLFLLVLP